MEALSAAQDDSSGANPSSIKSDDSSPRPDSRGGSPPPNCAICLGTCKNKSFTDSCLHQFCFSCLLTWSKVKAECPLCKQAFRSIIHNVRSNHQYEEYLVVQRQTEESSSRIDIDRVTAATHRFRYRTTLTLPRQETIAIQQLLRHYPFMADVFPPPAARALPARRRRSPASFRRTVYRHNLWARPLPDFTGRFRTCTPEFFRYNDTQMHRLVPWLNRELHYLLNENIGHMSYVMSRILDLLPLHHINSSEFREAMHRYFGDRTEHFLHELYCFASTPYDMTGYDRNVQYTTDSRISTMVNEVISSSDSEASVDSDIVMVSSSEPAEPPPGPSRIPAPVYPQNYISQPSANDSVIPIETISQSDTDDDSSEVMVVGYIKPPQERTPEIVDLLGSDSDVIVQDNLQPEPTVSTESQENRPVPSVKLTLKRHRSRVSGGASDSSDSSYRPPRRRRARAPCASTSDTSRTTPDTSPHHTPRHSPLHSPRHSPHTSPDASPRSPRATTIPRLSPITTIPRISPVASIPRPSPSTSIPRKSPSTSIPRKSPSTSIPRKSPSTSIPRKSPSTSIPRISPGATIPHISPGAPAALPSSAGTGTASTTTSDDDTDDYTFIVKRKSKKKSKESSTSSRDRKKSKKRSSHHKEKRTSQLSEKDKRNKRKSYSGKGVKSSHKRPNVDCTSPDRIEYLADEQPSTSGTSRRDKRKSHKERNRKRHDSRENRRLRSVVNVMYDGPKKSEIYKEFHSSDESNSINATTDNNYNNSLLEKNLDRSDGEVTRYGDPYRVTSPSDLSVRQSDDWRTDNFDEAPNGYSTELSAMGRRQVDTSSDSEDNLPLNLTLRKLGSFPPS